MSFILDALKKLEQKRQHGPVPGLLTVHEHSMPEEVKRRPVWQYFIIVALLLNAGILTIWLQPWRSEKTKTVTSVSASPDALKKSGEEARTIEVSKKETAENISQERQLQKTGSREEKKPVRNESLFGPATTVAPAIKDKATQTTGEQVPVVKRFIAEPGAPRGVESPTGIAVSEPGQKIPEMNELPLSVRQGLPNVTLTAHIYSNDPASRMVNINGEIYHEGQNVTAELMLEEITPSAAIFRYKDYRFFIRGF